jgi:heptaprenylglyceryl phosphate synthase
VGNQLLNDRIVLVGGGTRGAGARIARAAVRACATVMVTGSVIDWNPNVVLGMD